MRDLAITPDGTYLYAATFGRGIWRMFAQSTPMGFIQGTVTRDGAPAPGSPVVVSGGGTLRHIDDEPQPVTTVAGQGLTVPEDAEIDTIVARFETPSNLSIEWATLTAPDGTTASFPLNAQGVYLGTSAFTTPLHVLVGHGTKGQWSLRIGLPFDSQNGDIRVRLGLQIHFSTGAKFYATDDGTYAAQFLDPGVHAVDFPDALLHLSRTIAVGTEPVLNINEELLNTSFQINPIAPNLQGVLRQRAIGVIRRNQAGLE